MRFEARPKFFKDVASHCNCYVNIAKTLAKRFQMSVANNFLVHQQHTVPSLYHIGPSDEVLPCSFDDDVNAVVCQALHVCSQDSIFIVKWLKVGHYTFKPRCVVLCAITEGYPHFGLLSKIIALQSDAFFVVELLQTVHYDEHFHAYAVKHEDCPKLACVAVTSLKHHVPLKYHHVAYEGSNHLFVSLRHVVF